MTDTGHRDVDDPELTPERSLALIDATLRDTRRALGFSEWPIYLAWGVAWAVAFTVTHLVASEPAAPLADVPGAVIGLVWLSCLGGAVLVTCMVSARLGRGVTGTTTRIGRRLGVSWAAAMTSAGLLGDLLGLDGHQVGALFVFAVALLYVGLGTAALDDLQLAVGVWLLLVDVAALALGPRWFNLVLAVLGAGALLVAAAVAHRRDQRVGPSGD